MPNTNQRTALLAQTAEFSSANHEYDKLMTELNAHNLSAEECETAKQLKAQAMAVDKIFSEPNTTGADLQPDEVITENREVYAKVLSRMEAATETFKQINKELCGLLAKLG